MTIVKILCLSTFLMWFPGSSAFATAGASADCDYDGVNDVSCSGASCTSRDGPGGGCACFTDEGGVDIKICGGVGIYGPDAAPGWQAGALGNEPMWHEMLSSQDDRPVPEQPARSTDVSTDRGVHRET